MSWVLWVPAVLGGAWLYLIGMQWSYRWWGGPEALEEYGDNGAQAMAAVIWPVAWVLVLLVGLLFRVIALNSAVVDALPGKRDA